MRNVLSSTLLAIVVAFALLGAATSPAYADDGPVLLAPSALPGVDVTPPLPVFTDTDPIAVAPIVFTASVPIQILPLLPEAVGGIVDMFDPGDPGLPPD